MSALPADMARKRQWPIPWLAFLLIAGVFFFTGHQVTRSQYVLERSVEQFNPTEAEAREMLAQYETGTASKAAAYLLLGGFSLVILGIFLRNGRLKVHGLAGGLAVFFSVWVPLSLLWASEFPNTLNKVAIFIMLAVAALMAGVRFSDRQFVWFVMLVTGAYLAVGVGAELALGTFRPWISGYRFSGTIHPNGQGMNCALLVLAALFLYFSEPPEQRNRAFWLVVLAGFVFLVLTKSRTPFGVLFMTLGLYALRKLPLSLKAAGLSLAVMGVCVLVIFGSALSPLIRDVIQFGRTDVAGERRGATLSGRLELWEECLGYVGERPLLGYGYNSFWTEENTFDVADKINWISGSAHSIYFDVLIGLGSIGLLAFLLLLFATLFRLSWLQRSTGAMTFGFMWCVLVFMMLHGLMESAFIYPALYSFLPMAIIAMVGFRYLPETSPGGETEEAEAPMQAGRETAAQQG